MESNFSLSTDGQMPAFRGSISSNRLLNIFRVDEEDFWRVVRLMFGEEFLDSDCRSQTNLDISSLFVALALMVGGSTDEVLRVTSLVLRPTWSGGLAEVVARVEIGKGMRMVQVSWRCLSEEMGVVQSLVVWSASRSADAQMENARNAWRDVVKFMREPGSAKRAKMRGKQTPVKSQAPMDEDGRSLVRHQIPQKSAKVVECSLLRGGRPGTLTAGGMEIPEASPSQDIPNFSREEAIGSFRYDGPMGVVGFWVGRLCCKVCILNGRLCRCGVSLGFFWFCRG